MEKLDLRCSSLFRNKSWSEKKMVPLLGNRINHRRPIKSMFIKTMPKRSYSELQQLLSRLVKNHPLLWLNKRKSIKYECTKLAEELSKELNRPITEKKVRFHLKNVRQQLKMMEMGRSKTMPYCAYEWYAKTLGYNRAAEKLSKTTKKKFGEEIAN